MMVVVVLGWWNCSSKLFEWVWWQGSMLKGPFLEVWWCRQDLRQHVDVVQPIRF